MLAYIAAESRKRHMTSSGAETWDYRLEHDGHVAFHGSRSQMLAALAGCAAFTAIGVLLISLDDPPPAARALLVPYSGYLAIAFFGVIGIPILGWRAITGRPHVSVDADGLDVNGRDLVWHDIARIFAYRNTVVVTLTAQAYRRRRHGRGPIGRKIDNVNRRLLKQPAWSASISSVAGTTIPELAEWLACVHARFAD